MKAVLAIVVILAAASVGNTNPRAYACSVQVSTGNAVCPGASVWVTYKGTKFGPYQTNAVGALNLTLPGDNIRMVFESAWIDPATGALWKGTTNTLIGPPTTVAFPIILTK